MEKLLMKTKARKHLIGEEKIIKSTNRKNLNPDVLRYSLELERKSSNHILENKLNLKNKFKLKIKQMCINFFKNNKQ
jgi:hypothetical protein